MRYVCSESADRYSTISPRVCNPRTRRRAGKEADTDVRGRVREAGGFPVRRYAMANATCREAPRITNAKPLAIVTRLRPRRVASASLAHSAGLQSVAHGVWRRCGQPPARAVAGRGKSGQEGAVCAEDERRSSSGLRACRGVRRPRVGREAAMRAEHFPHILAHIPKIMPTFAVHCPAGLYVQDILQESAHSLYSVRVNFDTSQSNAQNKENKTLSLVRICIRCNTPSGVQSILLSSITGSRSPTR